MARASSSWVPRVDIPLSLSFRVEKRRRVKADVLLLFVTSLRRFAGCTGWVDVASSWAIVAMLFSDCSWYS